MRAVLQDSDSSATGRIEAPIVADGHRYCRRCLLAEGDLRATPPLTDRSTIECSWDHAGTTLVPRRASVEDGGGLA